MQRPDGGEASRCRHASSAIGIGICVRPIVERCDRTAICSHTRWGRWTARRGRARRRAQGRPPHSDGSRSKESTWTRARNPVSASSHHEHSILARRKHRDRSVWRRSPLATASRAQCGEACLSSRRAAGPPFTTVESRIRSPMSLRGHVWCAGESEESPAQRRAAATFYTFRRGFHTWKSTRPQRSHSVGWL